MNPNPNYRRRKILYVSPDFIVDLLTKGFRKSEYLNLPDPIGLPVNAKVISSFVTHQHDALGIVVEDASFPEVPLGEAYPTLPVEWSTVHINLKNAKAKSSRTSR